MKPPAPPHAPAEAPAEGGLGPDWPPEVAYAAWKARDARLDGRLFVGVTSTGIYCRPVCRVRLPRPENCRYFSLAAQAEGAGFRPCLRCRPELAPGLSAVDMPCALAWAAVRRLDAGALDHASLPDLAARLGVTDRHLRRVFVRTLGVSPVAYAQTRRLHLAKQMLADTPLDITQIALAAGFSSLRRFHALFRQHYRVHPGEWRRAASAPSAPPSTDAARHDPPQEGWRFSRSFRPPHDWAALTDFLAERALPGIEEVIPATQGGHPAYRRTVQFVRDGHAHTGWVRLDPDLPHHRMHIEVSHSLLPVLPAVLSAAHHLADLDADPDAIGAVLGPLAQRAPGLRLPGSVDGFELAVRAVLGQQVTVRAARTLASRLVNALGQPIHTPWPTLNRLFPTPACLATVPEDTLGGLGIVRQRARALVALAQAVQEGRLDLQPGAPLDATLRTLESLPGIGPWTARYIAMRALGDTDAWLTGDVVLRKALGVARDREAEVRSQAWRPWRAYAVLHLWRQTATRAADDLAAPVHHRIPSRSSP